MKNWYKSKTIWLGVIAVSIAVFESIQLEQAWPAVVLAAFGALAIVVRRVTSESIL